MNLHGNRDLVEFLGLQYLNMDSTEIEQWVLDRMSDEYIYAVTPNAQHIVLLHKNGRLRQAYASAKIVINDSKIVSRLARLSGKELLTNPGSDLTRNLLQKLEVQSESGTRSARVAIVGPNQKILRVLNEKYPSINFQVISAKRNLIKDQNSISKLARECASKNWDVLLICLGCPVQEEVALLIQDAKRSQGFALCAGASIDFLTGAQRRAPKWMQRWALEWLFRLLTNPTRLWRRYIIESPQVFRIWFQKEVLKKNEF